MNLIEYFFRFDKKTIMNPEQGSNTNSKSTVSQSGIKKIKINCIFLIYYYVYKLINVNYV